ncbi:glycosyltransferase [Petroclostridium xylanilyticum]|uniref:glycosyltransferase n=1 Tax=Petroclostridium xylanilyticum TaxID=1792311 RepID=UPI000B99C937|nr:glycosyltransferase [Petroclostridium xylanilyticum]
MNIMMITNANILDKSCLGIFKKMFAQARALIQHNSIVNFVYMKDHSIVIHNINYKNESIIKPRSRKDIYTKIIENVDIKEVEALYIRYPLSNYRFIDFLRNIKKKSKKIKVVVEFPTFPYDAELKNDELGLYIDRIYRRLLFLYVDVCVCYDEYKSILGIPAISITNGIEVEKVRIAEYKKYDENSLHLIAVGSISKWHGYDRLLEGLNRYYKKSNDKFKVYFHIVGSGSELSKLQQIVKQYGLDEYVIFWGSKEKRELDDIYEKCHIGIGSLGMHRIGLKYGAPLKVREYCARGIPFVIGYKDRDFSDKFEYVLNIENNEDPISVEEIITFYKKVYQNPDYKQKMRDYAVKNLTWEIKMKPIIDQICNKV